MYSGLTHPKAASLKIRNVAVSYLAPRIVLVEDFFKGDTGYRTEELNSFNFILFFGK